MTTSQAMFATSLAAPASARPQPSASAERAIAAPQAAPRGRQPNQISRISSRQFAGERVGQRSFAGRRTLAVEFVSREAFVVTASAAPGLVERFVTVDGVEATPDTAPEQRVFDGKPLPLVLTSKRATDAAGIKAWFAQNKAEIEKTLDEYGAILFRGFPLRSAEDFNLAVSGLAYECVDSTRVSIAGQLRALTDGPPPVPLWLHHEYPFRRSFCPSRLLFVCEKPAPSGGQMPLALSERVLRRLEAENPEFVKRALEKQLSRTSVFVPSAPGVRGWQDEFGVNDRAEAERLALESGFSRVEWDENGSMVCVPVCSPVKTHPRTGARVWFNNIQLDNPACYEPGKALSLGIGGVEKIYCTEYADGTPIAPEDAISARDATEAEAVVIQWQPGDVLLLDNVLCMHGRRPFEGTRTHYAALFC